MQALALKYRPKNFDELIGQEAVSKSLIHALDEGRKFIPFFIKSANKKL